MDGIEQNRLSNLHSEMLRLPEVMRRTGHSRSKLYALIRAGKIPKGLHPGNSRTVVWPAALVEEYIKKSLEDSFGALPPNSVPSQKTDTATGSHVEPMETPACTSSPAATNPAAHKVPATMAQFDRISLEILRDKVTGETWLRIGKPNANLIFQGIAAILSQKDMT
jgi:prophage regulatory protein